MKKICTSKKILVISYLLTFTLTAITVGCYFLYPNRGIDSLITLTGLAFAETAAATGFYYWKAKNENRIKLSERMINNWAEKYGFENVVELSKVVLSKD